MMRRFLMFARVLFLCFLGASASAEEKPIRTLNLEQIGYQKISCDVIWQGEDDYPKRRVEFLDNQYLLVHYATSQACTHVLYPRQALHSAVIDLSGRLMHTYEWQPGDEDVIAGPDGHILIVRLDEVRVVDLNFEALQDIPRRADYPAGRPFHVMLTPSRHGFAIIEENGAALYSGSRYAIIGTTTEQVRGVTDFGFVTLSGFNPGPPVLRVDGVDWRIPANPRLGTFVDTGRNDILGLDRKFNLYRIDQHGNEALIAHLASLAPGMWNSGFRFDVALPDAHRILFFSHGARIAFTDSSGTWYYFRSAVLDSEAKKFLFRYDGHIGDDVSLSPDGHLVAIRSNVRLSVYKVF